MSEMKRVTLSGGAFTLVAMAVFGLALLTTQSALANTRLGDGGQVPFYARFELEEVFLDDDWAVIVFYRPPGCIPADFNLLDFFHFPGPDGPGAFGCNPATTDGFTIWKNGPDIDMAPIQQELHGLGAVPVWFVARTDIEDAMSDGIVTIGELELLSSLLTGSADHFQEVLHASQAANNPIINYTASGSIDTGGSFWVHARASAASGYIGVQIDLDI